MLHCNIAFFKYWYRQIRFMSSIIYAIITVSMYYLSNKNTIIHKTSKCQATTASSNINKQ